MLLVHAMPDRGPLPLRAVPRELAHGRLDKLREQLLAEAVLHLHARPLASVAQDLAEVPPLFLAQVPDVQRVVWPQPQLAASDLGPAAREGMGPELPAQAGGDERPGKRPDEQRDVAGMQEQDEDRRRDLDRLGALERGEQRQQQGAGEGGEAPGLEFVEEVEVPAVEGLGPGVDGDAHDADQQQPDALCVGLQLTLGVHNDDRHLPQQEDALIVVVLPPEAIVE
mmetsp:Transcript_45659/g.145751  ORF Transcript_45659/g.145751 Transcript_45659/m.145751 type:complete len:225 (-) Transcript_45659:1235-1909(-)